MPSSSRRIFPANRAGVSCPGVQVSVSLAEYDGATVDPVWYCYQSCNCNLGFLPHYPVDSVGKLFCTLFINMLTIQSAILIDLPVKLALGALVPSWSICCLVLSFLVSPVSFNRDIAFKY